jgi:putative peptidoglycan lipid II flippase
MSEQPTVAHSARTVSVAVLGSRVLGLVREQVLAGLFGAHQEFDAFITAFRIPNLLRDLFAEGALSAAFVTTFTQKLETEGDKSAWRLANLVLNALLVVLSLITLAGIIIAPALVRAIAPGFAAIPGKVELTSLMTRIMFPFLLLIAIAAQSMGVLNAKHRFGVPASASMMFNIGSIVGGVGIAYLIDPHFGPRSIVGIAIGTLIGGALQWLIQIPSLRGVGYRYQPVIDIRDPGFRSVLRLLGPSVLGVGAVQINIFVDNWFASMWNGGVTWLNCAFRLVQFPIGVFGVAIAVATLPTVSAHVARGDMLQFRKTLARSIRLAFFLCVPAACGLAVLATPLVSSVYQHGRFDAIATAETARCLQMSAIGLAGYAAIKIIGPTFYALGDAWTPMIIAFASVVVNAGLDYVFAIILGMRTAGLALSTSCVALTNFALLLAWMRKRLRHIETMALLQSVARIAVASVIMTAAAQVTHRLLMQNRYLDVAGSILVALIVFGTSCKLLGVQELGELFAIVRFGAKHESSPPT